MRALLFCLAAAPALAQFADAAACDRAVRANPAQAREQAAQWAALGGGAAAKLCEAAALEALGAVRAAAIRLTEAAEDVSNGLDPATRAVALEDAGRLWLQSGQPALARAALVAADGQTQPTVDRAKLRARAEGQVGDWAAARAWADRAVQAAAGDAEALSLRAAARRRLEDYAGARADAEAAVRADRGFIAARFELAAAQALTGDRGAAYSTYLALIEDAPDHPLAAAARAELQRLASGD